MGIVMSHEEYQESMKKYRFEYRGYKVEIIKGRYWKEGNPFCFEYKGGSHCFNASPNNPSDFDEMVLHIKKELDRMPIYVPQEPYDITKKDHSFNLTKDVLQKRQSIIDEFKKQGFTECDGVFWAIDIPAENFDLRHCVIKFGVNLIQRNTIKGLIYEVWFRCTVSYREEDKEIIDVLLKAFNGFKFKPAYNGELYEEQEGFNLQGKSYFTEERKTIIREDHPLHGNVEVSFFLNPDYEELVINLNEPQIIE